MRVQVHSFVLLQVLTPACRIQTRHNVRGFQNKLEMFMHTIHLDINAIHIPIVLVVLTHMSVSHSCAAPFHFVWEIMKVSTRVMLSLVGRFGTRRNDELSLGLVRAHLIACRHRASQPGQRFQDLSLRGRWARWGEALSFEGPCRWV